MFSGSDFVRLGDGMYLFKLHDDSPLCLLQETHFDGCELMEKTIQL